MNRLLILVLSLLSAVDIILSAKATLVCDVPWRFPQNYGQDAHIACPGTDIISSIDFAKYGRSLAPATCDGEYTPQPNQCDDIDVVGYLAPKCVGNHDCYQAVVGYAGTTIPDPCGGWYKWLNTRITCVGGVISPISGVLCNGQTFGRDGCVCSDKFIGQSCDIPSFSIASVDPVGSGSTGGNLHLTGDFAVDSFTPDSSNSAIASYLTNYEVATDNEYVIVAGSITEMGLKSDLDDVVATCVDSALRRRSDTSVYCTLGNHGLQGKNFHLRVKRAGQYGQQYFPISFQTPSISGAVVVPLTVNDGGSIRFTGSGITPNMKIGFLSTEVDSYPYADQQAFLRDAVVPSASSATFTFSGDVFDVPDPSTTAVILICSPQDIIDRYAIIYGDQVLNEFCVWTSQSFTVDPPTVVSVGLLDLTSMTFTVNLTASFSRITRLIRLVDSDELNVYGTMSLTDGPQFLASYTADKSGLVASLASMSLDFFNTSSNLPPLPAVQIAAPVFDHLIYPADPTNIQPVYISATGLDTAPEWVEVQIGGKTCGDVQISGNVITCQFQGGAAPNNSHINITVYDVVSNQDNNTAYVYAEKFFGFDGIDDDSGLAYLQLNYIALSKTDNLTGSWISSDGVSKALNFTWIEDVCYLQFDPYADAGEVNATVTLNQGSGDEIYHFEFSLPDPYFDNLALESVDCVSGKLTGNLRWLGRTQFQVRIGSNAIDTSNCTVDVQNVASCDMTQAQMSSILGYVQYSKRSVIPRPFTWLFNVISNGAEFQVRGYVYPQNMHTPFDTQKCGAIGSIEVNPFSVGSTSASVTLVIPNYSFLLWWVDSSSFQSRIDDGQVENMLSLYNWINDAVTLSVPISAGDAVYGSHQLNITFQSYEIDQDNGLPVTWSFNYTLAPGVINATSVNKTTGGVVTIIGHSFLPDNQTLPIISIGGVNCTGVSTPQLVDGLDDGSPALWQVNCTMPPSASDLGRPQHVSVSIDGFANVDANGAFTYFDDTYGTTAAAAASLTTAAAAASLTTSAAYATSTSTASVTTTAAAASLTTSAAYASSISTASVTTTAAAASLATSAAYASSTSTSTVSATTTAAAAAALTTSAAYASTTAASTSSKTSAGIITAASSTTGASTTSAGSTTSTSGASTASTTVSVSTSSATTSSSTSSIATVAPTPAPTAAPTSIVMMVSVKISGTCATFSLATIVSKLGGGFDLFVFTVSACVDSSSKKRANSFDVTLQAVAPAGANTSVANVTGGLSSALSDAGYEVQSISAVLVETAPSATTATTSSSTSTTTGAPPSAVAPPAKKSKKLSGGAVAGIVIGVLAFCVIGAVVVYVVLLRRGYRVSNDLKMDRLNS